MPAATAPGRAAWCRTSSPGSGTAWRSRRRARRGRAAGTARAPSRPRAMSSSTPRPGASGTVDDGRRRSAAAPCVRRWPSCQIQCVSIAVISPGAAAATWVNIASETSKWLLECEPQVRPQSRQVCATRTEPAIVQKCGSASGMSTDVQLERVAQLAPVGGDHVGRGRQAGGAPELGHHLAARRSRPRRRTGPRRRPARRAARGTARSRPSSSQPPFGSSVIARVGEALVQRGDRLDLLVAAQHAALQLEVAGSRSAPAPPRPAARPPSGVSASSWRSRSQSSSASGLARDRAGRSCVRSPT